jgi:hypothetical protein
MYTWPTLNARDVGCENDVRKREGEADYLDPQNRDMAAIWTMVQDACVGDCRPTLGGFLLRGRRGGWHLGNEHGGSGLRCLYGGR